MQEIGVDGERRLAALVLRDFNLVGFGPGDELGARRKTPFAPRRDDADRRIERRRREFKPHLVIALAGRAMGDGVCAFGARDLDEALGDQGPRDRGAEEIEPFILGIGAEHREDEVAHEFFAQVLDVDAFHARAFSLAARRLELLALPKIGGEGHDLAAIFDLQPLQNDRCVEAAGVGEHDFLDVLVLGHGAALQSDAPRHRVLRGGRKDIFARCASAFARGRFSPLRRAAQFALS